MSLEIRVTALCKIKIHLAARVRRPSLFIKEEKEEGGGGNKGESERMR